MGRKQISDPKYIEWHEAKQAAEDGNVIIADTCNYGYDIVGFFFRDVKGNAFGVRCREVKFCSSDYRRLISFSDVNEALKFLHANNAA